MTVVVGVDGSGRTHRLARILRDAEAGWWFTGVDGLAGARESLVVVDDAHRLSGDVLRALVDAARAGTRMAISRRPTVTGPELAELDELVAAAGGVEVLGPLDDATETEILSDALGRPADRERVAELHEASAGMALVFHQLARGPEPAALVARVQRRFAVLPPHAGTVARVLALRLDLPDDVLAASARVPDGELPATLRTLREEGLLAGERMIPALADLVLGELSGSERRSLHDAVANAMLATGADPLTTAAQLHAARVRTPAAAEVYLRAGEQIRLTDPAAALSWFDDALDAGADPATAAPGRAEAATLLGIPTDVDPPEPDGTDLDGPTGHASRTGRLTLVAGAAAAHEGRAARAADALLAAPPPGPILAVPLLVAPGRLVDARTVTGTGPLARLATAAIAAATDLDAAVPLLIEAAEDLERTTLTAVLPDTPHAIGAIAAVAVGDLAAAEHLLTRANPPGGPAATERHRLLLAWARMRAGRYDTALAELDRGDTDPPGRERLLRAAIRAGIARRRGDIAGLHAVWDSVEPVLARRAVDLWQLEAVEELLVAAARLKHRRRVEPVLATLEAITPPAWRPSLGWLRVQVAIADGDVETVAAQAESLHGPRRTAARLWADVLAGDPVEPDEVHAVTELLAQRQLPWEASRLAGQAAIGTTDPTAARRLLERARELSEPDSASTASAAGLSERELDVARMVIAGSTHREIGAQLYISPKTVEHHVARIRTKLGATSRAELLAMLREIVS